MDTWFCFLLLISVSDQQVDDHTKNFRIPINTNTKYKYRIVMNTNTKYKYRIVINTNTKYKYRIKI